MSRKKANLAASIAITITLGALIALSGGSQSVGRAGLNVFAACVAAAFIVNWIVFIPSYKARTEMYFDLTGSLTYITVTVAALVLSGATDARSLIAAAMVITWALRLGSFLFGRIRRDGKDGRFDKMKHDFGRFLMTWTLQGLWVSFTVAAALAIITFEERVPIGVVGLIGILVWIVGFTIEVVADRQKSAFKSKPENAGRFITSGVWSWSRHPNYFGEITLWTGVAILAIPVLSGWGWVVLLSPVFVALLLTRISGIPLLERRAEKRWGKDPEFRQYTDSTSVLVPRPPKSVKR